MLDFLRSIATMLIVPRVRRQQRLDASTMLPMLALYARVHGYHAAVRGVPADGLLATLAEHPAEAATAAEYGAVATVMNRVAAGSAGGAGGATLL